MLVVLGNREGLHARRGGVNPHEVGNRFEKHPLSVPAWPVNEEQGVLADIAGQAIPTPLLQESDQLIVAARSLLKKLEPFWAVLGLCGANYGLPRDVIHRHGRSQPPCTQVHGTAR